MLKFNSKKLKESHKVKKIAAMILLNTYKRKCYKFQFWENEGV